jgi:uncharacterized protein (TIGR02246 family)
VHNLLNIEVLTMKTINKILFVIAVPISGLVNAQADDTSAISALNSNWDAAVNKGDTARLAGLYADDAVMIPPSSEILADREAIKDYWETLREVGIGAYEIHTIDLRVEGDKAYQVAVWEAARPVEGNVIRFEGNMSSVYERQKDGTWKIKLQSWN